MVIEREKGLIPGRSTQAYAILSLIAVSGELPVTQIDRLRGGRAYKEKLIKTLKRNKLIYTYYRDKLRGYRLTDIAKKALLADNKPRFASFFAGDTETSLPKYEITRRLRLHSIAEALVTMTNANVRVYNDEKTGVFGHGSGGNKLNQPVITPAFYHSREIKAIGQESAKIRGGRAVGVMLTDKRVYIVFNSGDSSMKWDYKSEMRMKAVMKTTLCFGGVLSQYQPQSVQALMLGGDMEQAYRLLTGIGGARKNYFMLDGSYEHFPYITNDHNGEIVLRLLRDERTRQELNTVLSENLLPRDARSLIENDAMDPNGGPVLFAYDCDMPRIARFNVASRIQGSSGTLICFDFQADTLRRFCGDSIQTRSIDIEKFERRFLCH